MATVTTKKREIIDYLRDWTKDKGVWSKLLVEKVVVNEADISATDMKNIFQYFLEEVGLIKGLKKLNIQKPPFNVSQKKIRLKKLSKVQGVNRLTTNQELCFPDNLLVIYGENGTGKTGYSRILKSLGISYDKRDTVHGNIYTTTTPKSGLINYTVAGKDKTFSWDGNTKNKDLLNLSIFNNDCVGISLSSNRNLMINPVGFHLFSILIEALSQLDEMLTMKIGSYSTDIDWIELLNEDTTQFKFISNLSSNSLISDFEKISNFTGINQNELTKNDELIEGLNIKLIEIEISNLVNEKKDLNQLLSKIIESGELFSKVNFDKLIGCDRIIKEAKNNTTGKLSELSQEFKIELYNSEEFSSFLNTAEEYIKLVHQDDYPNDKKKCIYCKQELEENSVKLLKSYREIFNKKSRVSIEKYLIIKEELFKSIKKHQLDHLNSSILWLDDKGVIKTPELLLKFELELIALEKIFTLEDITSQKYNFDIQKYITFIEEELDKVKEKHTIKTNLLDSFSEKKKDLLIISNELEDRKLLNTKKSQIFKIIENYNIKKLLSNKKNNFNTGGISSKTSDARKELITTKFQESFKEELIELRKGDIDINLDFSTQKGKSKISQSINKFNLADILSEGEQKAISLAEFLTELKFDKTNSPVVFDDPVNSLDYNMTDEVSKRLLNLSKERQVIVFTHDIILYNSFISRVKNPLHKSLEYKFYNIEKEFDIPGYIKNSEEFNTVNSEIKKINSILNGPKKGFEESLLASQGYGFLRSAIELAIENEVLQGVIKRYQKNVALTNFAKLDGSKIDFHKEKLNDIFEKCCEYIDGHSNPKLITKKATLLDLSTDFEKFKGIRNDF